jgi:error-prone DNA polymerase
MPIMPAPSTTRRNCSNTFSQMTTLATPVSSSIVMKREDEVVHIVARELTDLSSELASVGARGATATTPGHRAVETHDPSAVPEPREWEKDSDLAASYVTVDEIRVKTRDFR